MEALLDAAIQVLRRDGWAKLTTTRVAERAGVSVGSLYQYFPDKRSLVLALMGRYFEVMVTAVEAALDESEDRPNPVRLRLTLERLLEVKRAHVGLAVALRGPMVELDGAGVVRAATARLRDRIAHALGLGAGPRAQARAAILVAALDGALTLVVTESPEWLDAPWLLDSLEAMALGVLAA